MATSEEVTVKDLCPLIEDYLNGNNKASQIIKNFKEFKSTFDSFYYELQRVLDYLKSLPENEVISNNELLKFYQYLKDFDNLDNKMEPLFNSSFNFKYQKLIDEKIPKYFHFGFDFGGRKVIAKYNISKDSWKYDLFIKNIEWDNFESEFPSNLNDLIMKFGDVSFLPDKKIHPEFHEDSTKIKLVLYGREFNELSNIPIENNGENNPLLIEIFERTTEFKQIPEMTVELTSMYTGTVCINYKTLGMNITDFVTKTIYAPVQEWKNKFIKLLGSAVKLKYKTLTNEFVEVEILSSIDDPFKINKIKYIEDGHRFEIDGQVQAMNCMYFEVTETNIISHGLLKSFKSTLTKKGQAQLHHLEKQLLADSKIVRDSESFYAAFTSLVQSSGFGKTKLSVELLRKYPGIYLVFRNIGETGIPRQPEWIGKVFEFVFNATYDSIPTPDGENDLASDYGPTRFLLVLKYLIIKYKQIFKKEYEKARNDRAKALNQVANLIINDPKAENSCKSFAVELEDLRKDQSTVFAVINDIKKLLNADDETNVFMKDYQKLEFPFFLFLDEADHLNDLSGKGRVPGVNIVRRGLHLLDPKIRILVVAIGTNSNVLDFIPTIGDNSLRFVKRASLIPPTLINKNWDIYYVEHPYDSIEINEANLLDINMFKVLMSLGRPLWCSSPLATVISLAEAKLKNGDESKFTALFALLMVRASHTISPSQILAKTLVRSYMAIVRNVSTDGKELIISYSSEPALAMAARNLLRNKEIRFRAFFALKTFLQCQVIDKGRIAETIFEHLTLFAIDDAKTAPISKQCKDSNFPGKEVKKLVMCKNHLLELNKPKGESSSEENISDPVADNYRVVKVRDFLIKLLGNAAYFKEIEPFVSVTMLDGYVNCTHFVNLERFKKSDFEELKDQSVKGDSGCTIINKALLQVGLLRQCGFVMPPGYLGVDFIVPVLLKTDSRSNPIYSYIAIQSKSSRYDVDDVLKKLNPSLHYNPSSDQLRDELSQILSSALTIVLAHKGQTFSEPFDAIQISSSLFVNRLPIDENLNRVYAQFFGESSLVLKKIVSKMRSRGNKLELKKILISNDSKSKEEMSTKLEIKAPKLEIFKKVSENLSVHHLSWNETCSMSAIMINDISVMESLIDPGTCVLIEEILNVSSSPYEGIESIRRSGFNEGTLNGIFCNIPSLNPSLRKLSREKSLRFNTDRFYFKRYTESSVVSAISSSPSPDPEKVINRTFLNLDTTSEKYLAAVKVMDVDSDTVYEIEQDIVIEIEAVEDFDISDREHGTILNHVKRKKKNQNDN